MECFLGCCPSSVLLEDIDRLYYFSQEDIEAQGIQSLSKARGNDLPKSVSMPVLSGNCLCCGKQVLAEV